MAEDDTVTHALGNGSNYTDAEKNREVAVDIAHAYEVDI